MHARPSAIALQQGENTPVMLLAIARRGVATVGLAATAGLATYALADSDRRQAACASLLMQTASDKPQLFAWGRLAPASHAATPVHSKTREAMDVSFWSSRGLRVVQLSYGANHGAALDDKGGLWAWGQTSGAIPCRVPCRAPVSALASSLGSLYAVTSSGRVLEWRDLDAQLTNAERNDVNGSAVASVPEPKPLGGALARTKAASIAAGDGHLLVVGRGGEVVAMGDNQCGQLGLGLDPAAEPLRDEPTLLTTLPPGVKATHAACGAAHSLVALSDGGVVAFGDDRNLQLGLRQRSSAKQLREGLKHVSTPTRVPHLPDGKRVVAVAAGGGGVEGGHSVFLLRDDSGDELWTCGYGRFGALGLKSFSHQSDLKAVSALSKLKEWNEEQKRVVGVRVQAIACGERHTAALLATGNVFVWGWNDHGQLGSGGHQGVHTPTLVNAPPELRFSVMRGLSCGPNSVAAFS